MLGGICGPARKYVQQMRKHDDTAEGWREMKLSSLRTVTGARRDVHTSLHHEPHSPFVRKPTVTKHHPSGVKENTSETYKTKQQS